MSGGRGRGRLGMAGAWPRLLGVAGIGAWAQAVLGPRGGQRWVLGAAIARF
jgi:hypothetical protein